MGYDAWEKQSGFCNKMSNYITLHNDDICIITKTVGNNTAILKVKR